DLGKSEADSQQSIRHARIFVEPRRDTNWIRKLQVPQFDGKARVIRLIGARIEACLQRAQRQLVGVFRIESKQERSSQLERRSQHASTSAGMIGTPSSASS